MEPVIQQLLLRYEGRLRFEVRHLPLPVHREARAAAIAAECALEQDRFWPFHERRLLAPEEPPPPLPDPVAFDACVASMRPGERVDGDLALASALGVRVAPTFFVNERRLEGPQTLEAFVAAIEGDLPAQTDAAARPPAPERPPRERVVRLPRAGVELAAVAQNSELAPLDVQGHRLVRLVRVPEGGLLARMQLEPRDLLMQVDGAWLVDRVDPLVEALRTRDRVTLTIIRRGFPKTFVYELE